MRKKKLNIITLNAFAALSLAMFVFTGGDEYFIVGNVFVAGAFILGGTEK